MARKTLICHECKQYFEREELTQVTKAKRMCNKCFQTKHRESEEFKDLIDYVCKGFGMDAPNGVQLRNIKRMKEMGYTYHQIKLGVYYTYAIRKASMENKSLGLVEFYVDKGIEHHRLQLLATESAKNFNHQQEIVIKIGKQRPPNVSNTRYIDLDELIKEEVNDTQY